MPSQRAAQAWAMRGEKSIPAEPLVLSQIRLESFKTRSQVSRRSFLTFP
jgi:hypothetical protein